MNQKSKPCRFFLKGSCRFTSDECKFSHDEPVSESKTISKSMVKEPVSDPTRILAQKFTYQSREERQKEPKRSPSDEYGTGHGNKGKGNRRAPINTESFEPNYNPSDLRVIVDVAGKKDKCELSLQTKDIVIIPDLFGPEEDWDIHQKLLEEMEKSGIDSDRLWKLWHGDSHMIADDSTHFKEKCPTFIKILDRIRDYFQMDIKATRFNLYRDDNDWKPFHFDASALKEDKAKIQNITVGISFGRTREIAFEDALEPKGHRRIVSFPMPNGSTYAFCKDINLKWRHGVPAIPKDQQKNQSRISIIAWGWKDQMDV